VFQEEPDATIFGLESPKSVVFCETCNEASRKVHSRAEEPFFFNELNISKLNHS
jgi:hypothetical protein